MTKFWRLGVALALVAGFAFVAGGSPVTALVDHEFSIADATGSEAGNATLTVTVDPPPVPGQVLTVQYRTPNNTGSATRAPIGDALLEYPEDYSYTDGTLTFDGSAGDDTQTFTVPVSNDDFGEPNETFDAEILNPDCVDATTLCSGATADTVSIADGLGVYTIDDDDAPSFSVNDPGTPTNEGDDITFIVTRTGKTAVSTSVQYATADGSATAGSDYTAKSATLNFDPSANLSDPQNVVVVVADDAIDEPTETFLLNLSNPSGAGATISDGSGTGTIPDDDSASATFSINDVTVTEGNSGTTNATFTVTKAGSTQQSSTVEYDTGDSGDTATEGTDYVSGDNGTLTFLPSETTKTITVAVNGETAIENDETFTVVLSSPLNATISDDKGIGTIQDDDTPTATIGNATSSEGDLLSFTITLNPGPAIGGSPAKTATVHWAAQAPSGSDTAEASDYNTAASGDVVFEPGDTQKVVTVASTEDGIDETDETFRVLISKPVACCTGYDYKITDATGVGTITNDDDGSGGLSIADVQVNEGDGTATFTVTRSNHEDGVVTVDWETASDTAIQDQDFTGDADTLTFAADETEKTIEIDITDDAIDEADEETFFINLSNATPGIAISDPQAIGTIDDNDDAPNLTIDDPSVSEGDSGTKTLTFTVTKNGETDKTVGVSYATADSSASAGSDYVSASGALSFAPADETKTIAVTINGDTIHEPNETFLVNLTSPSNATIADGQGTGTITNDDAAPVITIGDVTVTEGNSGNTAAVFNVTRTGSTSQTVAVDFATADGSATAGSDYTAASGSVSWAPADPNTKTITVQVTGDTADEPNETFVVNLTNPSNATNPDTQGTGSITDDDAAPVITIGDVTVTEGSSGNTAAVFNVTRTGSTNQTVTVGYATANGTATAGSDYTAASGTVSWAPADGNTKTITVQVTGDTADEATETFFVNLTSPATNATVSDSQATGTITDDDAAPIPADFNGDGFGDAAMGVPGEDIGAKKNAGSVNVIYGTGSGLSATAPADQVFSFGSTGVTVGEKDRYGHAVAAADFNNDGFDDLAVGAPGDGGNTGAVAVIYGTSGGLQPSFNQLWRQDSGTIGDTSEGGDLFGSALAAGDLNGDGNADLAIGAPGESIGSVGGAGAVNVLYGSASSGLADTNNQLWTQEATGIADAAEAGDRFGGSVAIGDLNGDGEADLVIGASNEGVGATTQAGLAHVVYGTTAGLSSTNSQTFDQNTANVLDDAESGDRFAFSVTAGDVNGDGFEDVAFGVPKEDATGTDAGAVNVLLGSGAGLTATGSSFFQQGAGGVMGSSESADQFGFGVAIGDYDGDSFGDLAVAVPGEAIGSTALAGAVNVLYGTGSGLGTSDDALWFQDSAGISGASEKGDLFGSAISAADFNGDGRSDLNVGVRGEDLRDKPNAGAAAALYGAPTGIASAGNQVWHQDSGGVAGTAERGDAFGSAAL